MAVNVADLVARLSVDVSAFKAGLDQAARQMQTFSGLVDQSGRPIASSFQGVTDQAKKLGDETQKLSSGPLKGLQQAFMGVASQGTSMLGAFAPLLAGFTGIGAAIGLVTLGAVKSIEAFTGFATQVRDLSFLSGGSARDVSVLVNGLDNLGVNAETVEVGLNRMSAEITSGGESLSKLGISIRDTSGNLKSGLTLFYETVDALGRMTNAVERNSLAREIFGRGWTQMLPVLQRGSGVIRELGEEAFALGKAIDEGGIEKAYEFQKSLRDLGDAWEGFKIQVGGGIIAPITYLLKWVTTTGKEMTPEDLAASAFASPGAEAFWGVGAPTPGKTAGVPGWSDVGAGGLGGASRTAAGIPAGIQAAELEKQVKLNVQLAQLDAQRLAALAAAIPMSLARIEAEKKAMEAALKVKQIQVTGELDLRDLTKKTTDEQAETARLRMSTAQMFAAQRVAVEKQAEDAIKKLREEYARVGVYDYEAIYAEGMKKADEQVEKNRVEREKTRQGYMREEALKEGDAFLLYAEATVEQVAKVEQEAFDARQKMREMDLSHQYRAMGDQADGLKRALDDRLISYQTYYLEIEKLQKKNLDLQKQVLLGELAATDDYFDAVRLGLAYHVTDWRTADQKILDITKEMSTFALNTVSDVYFAGLTGQIMDFEDFWRAAWKSMARIVADELGRITLSSLFGVGGVLGPTMGGGGGNATANGLSYYQLSQQLMDQGVPYNDAVRIASNATSGGGGGAGNTALSTAQLVTTAGGGGGGGIGPLTGGGLLSPVAAALSLPGKIVALAEAASKSPVAVVEAILGLKAGTLAGTAAIPVAEGAAIADMAWMGPEMMAEVLSVVNASTWSAGAGSALSTMTAAEFAAMEGLQGVTAATTTATAATEGAAVAMEGVAGAAGSAVPALGMVAPALLGVSAIAMVIMDQLGKGAEEARWNARVEQAKQVYAATPGSAQQAADLLINAETGGAAAGLSYNVSTGRWESTAGQVGQGVQIQALADAGMLSEREMETLYWSRLQAMTASGGGGGGGEGGSGRQHGGPVRAGRPYLVGEAGPELIIPRDAGTVVPNRQIREAMGGGGALNVIVNVAGSLVGVGSKDELIRYIMSGIRQLNRRLPGVNMFPVTG